MNRFTQSYVVGAMSGTAMVVAAVVAFVVLLSFQAVRDWPGSGISIGIGHDDSGVAVGPAQKAPPGVGNPVPAGRPAVSAAAVAGAAAPPASVPAPHGGRQAHSSHHHGAAVDEAVGRGGLSRGSQISGTPSRGGAPTATPAAPPAEPAAAPTSPGQSGYSHSAAHTNSANGGGPSSTSGNGNGNGNGHGGGSHGAVTKHAAPAPAPQTYASPSPTPEAAPTAEPGNGHGNAYGHENAYTAPGNSENAGGAD